MLRGPASAGHHDRPRFQAINLTAAAVGNAYRFAALRRPIMLHAHHRGTEPNACPLTGLIERGKIHSSLAHGFERLRAWDRRGQQRLDHVSRKATVASGKGVQLRVLSVVHRVAVKAEGIGGKRTSANPT